MRVYWLCYVRDGETRVVIIDAWSLMHARLCAACLNLGTFIEGHPIEPATMARVPLQAVGRVMCRPEAMALLGIPDRSGETHTADAPTGSRSKIRRRRRATRILE
jgi:hypothetical protein